jgi:hypothetical protein
LRLSGLDWRVPDFSTVCRRQKTLRVQLPYRASTTALDLLVDSTGIKFLDEGEWKCKQHGAEYRWQWRKVHLGMDAHTLEIGATEVTDNSAEDSAGGAPMRPELLAQIPPDEALASVSTDGACDTKACHAAIVQRGAQAVIPPRKNGKPGKAALVGAGVRNEALKAGHRLGHAIWKPWSGDHRTSLGGRPRYMASSAWVSRSWRARSSLRWCRCMCVWHGSTASRNSGAQPRCPWPPWHSFVWGWGHSLRFRLVQQSQNKVPALEIKKQRTKEDFAPIKNTSNLVFVVLNFWRKSNIE